jgi:hypothetical protein
VPEVLARGAKTRDSSYTGATAGSMAGKVLYNAKSSTAAETGLKPRADWIFQSRSQKSRDRRIRSRAETA